MPIDSVISQLDKLVRRGALGKCDTEVGVIAEYAGRRGWGDVGGAGTLARGQAAVLGCSWAGGQCTSPPWCTLSRPGRGKESFRDQNVTGMKGGVGGQCPPKSM